jgi:GTP-binding protein
VIGVVNKVDDDSHEERGAEFFEVGLNEIFTVSAEHRRGLDDLQDAIAKAVGFDPDTAEDEGETETAAESKTETDSETDDESTPHVPKVPRIAIVGRPNVGKSTFTNVLIQEDRMITSPIAGTTIDAVDSVATLNDKPYVIIDTAGIRRKDKTEQGVEVLSVVQAKKALERADIALLLIDGEIGVTDQDEKIGGLVVEVGCSVVIVVNKWDTQSKTPKFTREHAAERIREKMGYLKFAPILFTSAIKGQGHEDLGDLLEEIMTQKQVKLTTHEFTKWVRNEATIHNPMNAKFFMCHQSGRHPPTFVCHVSDPEKVHFSLRRHLVNALRDRWGYMGTPVRMLFVEGKTSR